MIGAAPQIRSTAHNIVNEAYGDCVQILESYSEALKVATEEILEEEQITGKRLQEIMEVRARRTAATRSVT